MDEPLEVIDHFSLIVSRILCEELDNLAIAVGCFLRLLTRFVDHSEAVISVVDLWIIGNEPMGGLLGFVEFAVFDQIDHRV